VSIPRQLGAFDHRTRVELAIW
jgi:hypothetical protein